MKSITFTQEELGDLEKLKKQLFCDEKDPRSPSYVRKLVRPQICWWRVKLYVLCPLAVVTALIVALIYFGVPTAAAVLIPLALYVAFALLTGKQALICAVRIYQRYAPDSVRNKCRFEPSCSEYMILSLEKYGLFKGLKKGIGRIRRCNVKGGGFDFP